MSLSCQRLGSSTASESLSLTRWTARRRDLALRRPMQLPFGLIKDRPSCWLEATWAIRGRVVTGWGEGATLPLASFTDDSGDTIVAAVELLTGHLSSLGETPLEGLVDAIASFSFPNGEWFPTARLTVEMALLDGLARSRNASVARLLGLITDVVPVGTSIGASDRDSILSAAKSAIKGGSSKIKLKVSPESCDEVIAAIDVLRKEHFDLALMVDANGTFDPANTAHVAQLRRLDGLDLLMIEEPVSQTGLVKGIGALRLLQSGNSALSTPICADDCLKTETECLQVMGEHLVEVLNLKPGRIGSFLSCLDLVDRAADADCQVFVGGMLEATPGRCLTATLAAYCRFRGFTVPGDTSLAQDRLSEDLVPASSYLQLDERGNLVVPDGVGWGFHVS